MANYVKVKTSRRRNEVARYLKLQNFILSFLLLSRMNIGLKKQKLRTLCKVLILCDFLNLGCFGIKASSRQP